MPQLPATDPHRLHPQRVHLSRRQRICHHQIAILFVKVGVLLHNLGPSFRIYAWLYCSQNRHKFFSNKIERD
jgi:hypothetical protein